jgi:hypothetical protein
MKHLILENIILLNLGMGIAFLLSLSKFTKRRYKGRFIFGRFVQENFTSGGMALLSAIASLMLADTIANSMGVIPVDGGHFYQAHAFLSGLLNTLVIERVKKIYE